MLNFVILHVGEGKVGKIAAECL